MSKSETKQQSRTMPFIIAAYAIGAFLTFGHIFNQNYVEPTPVVDCGQMPEVLGHGWDAYWDCRQSNIYAPGTGTSRFEAGFPAAYAAIAWPIYWGGHFAIKVTK
ncbi:MULTISPECIES: hypothetical protein [unclassified Mesorhizobium]|uniref:hypothetical protein n=1 Tax=unclassified Mesorhizobium TaxID=325217 RepID=UPI00112761C2|nr:MULTISPECIES: hypothetical protein [unclassified Mesorhizobium]TPJ86974.1 hypothetical protein FJ489_30980 [Mesorhizobium sp. B2-5-12]TPK19197.1 hypothetical protein FJ562_31385 [Mesorhizobium sp. B2-5-6]